MGLRNRKRTPLELERPTVKPFFNVVVSVFAPRTDVTGVAKPLFNGRIRELAAERLRMPCARLNASLLDAIRGVELRGRYGV